jgi:hypothetical protein
LLPPRLQISENGGLPMTKAKALELLTFPSCAEIRVKMTNSAENFVNSGQTKEH